MPTLFGKSISKAELLASIGDLSQIGGVQQVKLVGGYQDGVDAVEFRTGSGLSFRVVPGRGLDISLAEYRGIPLAWRTPAADTASPYYNEPGLEWLRSFSGGLLTTCGLTYVGAPCVDQGEPLGLHGRISNTPATNVSVDGGWEGDEYRMWVSGKLREYRFKGENLVLRRRISALLGQNKFWIDDEVTNEGNTSSPHMILYHINGGFPVVAAGSAFVSTSDAVTPRDSDAEVDSEHFYLNESPSAGYLERCYYHSMSAASDGFAYGGLVNKDLPIGFYVKYRTDELPVLTQWKMNGVQEYVVGMEPANCHVEGRAKEREQGTLQFLEPGETRQYHLEVGVLSTLSEIDSFEETVRRKLSE